MDRILETVMIGKITKKIPGNSQAKHLYKLEVPTRLEILNETLNSSNSELLHRFACCHLKKKQLLL